MVLIILILIFSNFVQADESVLGERNIKHYFGPTHPTIVNDFYKYKTEFEDDYFTASYLKRQIQTEVFNLNDFLSGEMHLGLSCPDFEFYKLKDELHFYIRLITLSYLYQGLGELQFDIERMDSGKSCFKNRKDLFKYCKPKSQFMKNFVKSAKGFLKNDKKVLVSFEEGRKSTISKWIKDINRDYPPFLAQKLLQTKCQVQKCDTKKKVSSEILNLCEETKKNFTEICSEVDKNFGVSHVPELYHILTSQGVEVAQKNDYFNGCLKRFIEGHESKEFKKTEFSIYFKYLLHQNLKKDNLRGELFKIGELNEIYKRGFEDIFQDNTPKLKVVEKKENKPVKKPKFEKIDLPKFTKKKVKRTKEIPKIKDKPKKQVEKKSAFYIAAIYRKRFENSQVSVDMGKFKYDYIFSLNFVTKYEQTISKFSSLKSLKEMKKFDKLGTNKAPVPLRFLKFLIDQNKHQNLYNIIQVLGDTFKVENDIDKKHKELELVRIENSEETNHKWQLFVIKSD